MNKLLVKTILLAVIVLTFTNCNQDDEYNSSTGKIIVNTTVAGYGIIAGVNVSLVESASDTYVKDKVTNSEGKVTFDNVLPGTYYIDCDYVPSSSDEHIGESDDFQLIAGQTKTINVALD